MEHPRYCDELNCTNSFYSKRKCTFHYNKLAHVKQLRILSKKNNPTKCSIPLCGKPHEAKGFCHRHYYALPEVKARENLRRRNDAIHQAELRKKYLYKKKFYIINYYSKGKMECACCGEKTFEFLTINHINGGGLKHRRELKSQGTDLYNYLKKELPEGYNVLCMNCNFADGHYKICPHEKKSKLMVVQNWIS